MRTGENRSVFLRFIHDIYTLNFLFNDYTKNILFHCELYCISYYMYYIYIYVLYTV